MKRRPSPSVGSLQEELSRAPFMRGVSKAILKAMAQIAREKSFAEGSVILQEGQPARHLFILIRGAVALSFRRGEEELIMEIVKKRGELLGWSALVPPRRYTATAKALKNSCLLSVKGKDMEGIFRHHPSFGQQFYRNLSTLIATRLQHTRLVLAETMT